MNGVTVRQNNGETININVIRYFKLNGFDYLIFSLNEIDDGGYVKLYISKIVNGVGTTITDDVEWNLVKDTIKDIIKRNKDGIENGISDLEESTLVNIMITGQKVFKLNDSLLQLLSANKNVKVVNDNVVVEETINDAFSNLEPPAAFSNEPMASIENNINNQNAQPLFQNEIAPLSNEINNNIEPQKEMVSDMNSNLYYGVENINYGSNLENNVDYKTMYEAELKKNEELLQELNKYQNLINDLKAVLK